MEIQHIQKILQRSFDKDAWHGPTVLQALDGVDDKIAQSKLPNTHSIIELVAHMTSWRIYVVKKLQSIDYNVPEDQNFPKNKSWKDAIHELKQSQQELMKAIANFPEEKLEQLVPNTQYNYKWYTMLHGIVHHDLYHTGQIMLIKKAMADGNGHG